MSTEQRTAPVPRGPVRRASTPAEERTPHLARGAVLGPGFWALFGKEVLRFWKVAFQTIVAPVVTTLLYLLIFAHVLEEHVRVHDGQVAYTAFLVPGLIMMSVLQNAFANSSSSLIQSKMMRNLIFILLPPITSLEIYLAYVLGAVVRGLAVGFGVWLATLPFVPWRALVPDHPLWSLSFAFFGSFALGTLGLIAGIWSEKFDHLAVFQNFFIMPLTFLSGVFYSIHSLPAFWQTVSHLNPFFYMIDGFRYGFFGVADVSPWRSLAVLLVFNLVLSAVALRLLVTGYKLRS
ncbi:MAG: ABC transporter permease [Casimicrobiaceae bacterium]